MTENENMVMPVAPMYGGSNGFGGFGSDAWLILILLFAMGGWGNGFGGGFGGQLGYDFPWLLNGQQGINANTNTGFNQAALQSSIGALQNSVTAGFGDVQLGLANVNQNICQTGNTVTNAVTNGFNQAEIANNSRQIANMQQAFANQTAMNQGFNGLQSQLANCCCENRLGIANLSADIAREECATRTTDTQNTQTLLTAFNQGFQSIKDQLCQDKIDAKNDTIDQLRSELLYARGQASQDVQTATLRASQATTANQLVSELRSCPIPAMPVYGQTPIFTCNQGCGCSNF